MMGDITLWIFNIAILLNVYALFRFWQAMRRFTESQKQLNEMLKRDGYGDAPMR